jgi:hypothetical protein
MPSPRRSKLVTLATFPTEFQARVVKNALKENGVRASFAGGVPELVAYGVPYGCTLVVAEKDLAKATTIINEVRQQAEPAVECEPPQDVQVGDRILRISAIGFLLALCYGMIQVFLEALTGHAR